jgi:hypothetical protein
MTNHDAEPQDARDPAECDDADTELELEPHWVYLIDGATD